MASAINQPFFFPGTPHDCSEKSLELTECIEVFFYYIFTEPDEMGRDGDREHRVFGQVLVGPHHRRVRA